jgi:uncharacterized protein (DUF1800 family)
MDRNRTANTAETPEESRSKAPRGLSRRDWLRLGAAAGVALAGAGCADIQRQVQRATGPTPPDWTPLPPQSPRMAQAVHVLNRAAFGPRPGDIARVANVGAQAWIEEQLAVTKPEQAYLALQKQKVKFPYGGKLELPEAEDFDPDEDPAVRWRVGGLDVHEIDADDPDQLYCHDDGQLVRETGQAALLRAAYSRHQIREVMADFWTNHFNIYALKLEGRSLVPIDTERVIRPHVLGSFEEMLKASAHSPAMLTYLDNKENKNGVANENYARELLELHTLGVRSGYTQNDIQAVARCFTGWTVGSGFDRAKFLYDPKRHDEGAKYIPFLHLHIMPNGNQSDADSVLTRLARHPATARFLAAKICRRILGDTPPDVVEKAASAYLKSESGSSIRALLRPILLDALLDPAHCKPIVKRPLDMMVTALRCLAADTDGGEPLLRHLANMGQPLYQWPMPDGFPEKSSAWTSTLLPRWNFAIALATNGIKGTTVDLQGPIRAAGAASDAAVVDTLMEAVLGRPHSTRELAALRGQVLAHVRREGAAGVKENGLIAETAALLLASPSFQWKA